MENASKALIMAASIMITLVIIGAVLLVFNNMSDYQKLNQQVKNDSQVIEFNNRFETYNRTDVRGSDIFSLINKVLDYNKRQSIEGIEGSDIGYEPIKLTIDLGNNKNNIMPPLTTDDTTYKPLIKKDEYIINGKENEFEDIFNTIYNIENEYNQTELTQLAVSTSSIFLGNNPSDYDKKQAVEKYNIIVKNPIASYSQIAPGTKIRKDVYNYYEYIQFKRTYFDCSKDLEGKTSGVVYDNNNGRIIEMYFVGNGKIE